MPKKPLLQVPVISLAHYLILVIVIIIIFLSLFLSILSYSHAEKELMFRNRYLEEYTELNAVEAMKLVDRGLVLYDDSLNQQMKTAFFDFLAEYGRSGGDPARIDLDRARGKINATIEGKVDLYVINESGVIIRSTVPEVLYLDFERNFPNYNQKLQQIRKGDSFSADRVVRSVTSTAEGKVTGDLRKFAFMPTTDHRYLLETGLNLDLFDKSRGHLTYNDAADNLILVNPNLVRIRIFDSNKNIIKNGVPDPSFTPDPSLSAILDEVFSRKITREVADLDAKNITRYLLVELNDPGTASDMNLVLEMTYTLKLRNMELFGVLLYHVVLCFFAIMLGVILAVGASRLITRPIEEIIEDVDCIAQGDLDHRIRTMKAVELIRLENSISLMIGKIRQYSKELERKRVELQIAAHIQKTFLPRSLPSLPGFDIAALSIPAREVGGDFYDTIPIGGSGTGIVIADVSGKGVPAALFMALTRTVLRSRASAGQAAEEVIREANRRIAEDAAESGMFVTAFYGLLDVQERTLSYVNAGHNPPVLVNSLDNQVKTLPATGIALGILEEQEYTDTRIPLERGDVLVLYTDGVTEAINEAGEQFGEERLIEVIRQNAGRSAREIIAAITERVVPFCGSMPQYDDVTILVLRVLTL